MNIRMKRRILLGVISLCLGLIVAFIAGGCEDRTAAEREQRGHELVAESKIQYWEGDYNAALSTLHKYLKLSSERDIENNPDDVINAYLMLGNIHLAFGDYIRAFQYYEEGLKASRMARSADNQVKFLNDLAIVSCYLGNRDDALKYNEMLADVHPSDVHLQRYLHLITSAYIEKRFGNPVTALKKMKEAMAFIDENRMEPRRTRSSLSEISEYFEENNMLDSALAYLHTYEKLALEQNANDMLVDNKRRFMRVYTKLGDTREALRYQEEYFSHTDSVMNPHRFLNVSNRFQKENEDRASLLIKDLRQTVTNQKIILLIVAFSSLLLALWLFYRHKARTANIQLFKRNKELVEIEDKVREIGMTRYLPEVRESTPVHPEADPVETKDAEGRAETPPAQRRELFDTILRFMDEDRSLYCDPDFSLTRLAELTDSNTKYVSQAINDFTGKNFRTFINEYRIREARRRLLDSENFGNVTIQYLAESVGFLSTSAFNMAFRKFTGMTPSLYQKLGREMDQ